MNTAYAKNGDPRQTAPLFKSTNRLKLGAFSFNVQRGGTASTAEGSIASLDWPQQVRIARACESAGLDAIIPIARWKGVIGESHYWRESYDTFAWAAALAAATERITVFATVHVPLIHPIRAAKNAVTIDHISGGRFALNIVAGWNDAEFAMFGKQQRPHDERYREAAEWVELVQKLWVEKEEFDWKGTYYQVPAAISEPRPLAVRPVLMSAGSSPAGRAFAAQNADIIFAAASTLETISDVVREIKDRASQLGRSVQVWTLGGVLCCQNESELKRQYNYIVHEKGDWVAAKALASSYLAGGGQSHTEDQLRKLYEGYIAWGHSYPLMGAAEQITDKMLDLADTGLDGLALMWLDYEDGLQNFRENIRPLAEQAGLMARVTG